MKYIIEALIDGKHYSWYAGYSEIRLIHMWADDKKDAKIYVGKEGVVNILQDLLLLEHDYSHLKFNTIEIKD